jgi:hypothetical protein
LVVLVVGVGRFSNQSPRCSNAEATRFLLPNNFASQSAAPKIGAQTLLAFAPLHQRELNISRCHRRNLARDARNKQAGNYFLDSGRRAVRFANAVISTNGCAASIFSTRR